MRKLVVSVILLFALAVRVMPASAIVYGDLDGKGHPNVGLISRPSSDNPKKQFPVCSGILIDPHVFLTAGHCTKDLETRIAAGQFTMAEVKVSFNTNNALEKNLLGVEDIHTHPEFDGRAQSDDHDLGAIILSKPVNGVTLASLPSEGFLNNLQLRGVKFTVVGYGSTLEFPPPKFIFPDGKRRVAQSEFQTLLEARLVLSQNQATDGAGTCHGDSGGPAFWTENGAETLVAITSLGDPNCVAIGKYYRLDTESARSFLDDFVTLP